MQSAARRMIAGARGALVPVWALLLWVSAATAHEVRPSSATLSFEGGAARLDLRLNAEAFLAGIDLDDLENTDAAPQSNAYDRLRMFEPEDLVAQLETAWPRLAQGMRLTTRAGAPVPMQIDTIESSEIGDASLPRPTRVILTGNLPAGTDAVRFHWGRGQGALVLRHSGARDGLAIYLAGGATSDPIPVAGGTDQGALSVLAAYVPVGFAHILPRGLDHILFVLGLYFFSTRLRPLVWQITAFTAAHTVTLALGALGMVRLPPELVEPLIAASIVFVAVENIFAARLHAWRPAIVFGFGLLHGLGFASVLGEFGLPEGQFLPALLGFNIGVEIGQLTVVAIAFLAVGVWFRDKPWYRARIAVPASAAIALVGAYWFVERTVL